MRLAFAITGILLLPGSVAAQTLGIPDFSGNWAADSCLPADGGPCPFVPENMPLHPRAKAHMEIFDEPIATKYSCVQASLPSLVADPYAFKFEQRTDRVVLTYEKDDVVRTVWLQGHGHPDAGPYDFSIQGHSVGWYEDDEFVIETTKFAYDPTGLEDLGNIPSSTEKRVIERYRRDGDQLILELEVADPVFLTEPTGFSFQWTRSEEDLVLPYGCDPVRAREPLKYLPSKWQTN